MPVDLVWRLAEHERTDRTGAVMTWWIGVIVGIAGGVLSAGIYLWITLSKTFRDF